LDQQININEGFNYFPCPIRKVALLKEKTKTY